MDTEIPSVKDVKVGGFDLNQFAGQNAKIAKISMLDVNTCYDENGGYVEGLKRPVKVLKIETEVITTFENDSEEVPVRASELFNMVKDKELNEWGLSTSPNSKYRKFLKSIKANELKDVIGKSVTIKCIDRKGSTYLGFYTE